jgi:diphthine synthase
MLLTMILKQISPSQIRRCTRVYLECYTSLLSSGLDWSQLEQFYGRPLVEADREMVEQNIGEFEI